MAVEIYDRRLLNGEVTSAKKLSKLDRNVYMDSDIPSALPKDRKFSP